MNFKQYWTALDGVGKRELAEQLGTSLVYLSQVSGGKRVSAERAKAIHIATGYRVTLNSLNSTAYNPGMTFDPLANREQAHGG